MNDFWHAVGGLVAVLMVAVPVLMFAARAVGPWCVRFVRFARRQPLAATLLAVVVGAFVVYGATKPDYFIDVRNYSGTYDGQSHAARVDVYEYGYYGLDYVEYSTSASGPYNLSHPPAFVDAGVHTVYYSAYKMDDERQFGSCTVTIAPKRLTAAMVGEVEPQSYTGELVGPEVPVADGDLLTTNDYAGKGGGAWFPGIKVVQLDAEYCLISSVKELFLQDTDGILSPLPALPADCPDGTFTGVPARGGFTVDLSWRDGALSSLRVVSARGERCRIELPAGTVLSEPLPAGAELSDGILSFPTEAGSITAFSFRNESK